MHMRLCRLAFFIPFASLILIFLFSTMTDGPGSSASVHSPHRRPSRCTVSGNICWSTANIFNLLTFLGDSSSSSLAVQNHTSRGDL